MCKFILARVVDLDLLDLALQIIILFHEQGFVPFLAVAYLHSLHL